MLTVRRARAVVSTTVRWPSEAYDLILKESEHYGNVSTFIRVVVYRHLKEKGYELPTVALYELSTVATAEVEK